MLFLWRFVCGLLFLSEQGSATALKDSVFTESEMAHYLLAALSSRIWTAGSVTPCMYSRHAPPPVEI